MAIDAYVGKPRSGKSYSVVKQVILPSLKSGRHVYTNIPLTELAHDEFPGMIHQLEPGWYEDVDLFDKIPDGSVVVLDEVWRRWPKGMNANSIPKKDKAFLAEHGHLVNDLGHTTRVILVTQDLDQISNFCMTLIDKTYQSIKLDALGASSKFRVDIYEGAAKGQRPPKSQLIRSSFDSYSDKVYRYYKSATKSQTDNVGDESRADKRASAWRSPFLWFAIVAPFVVVPLGLWYLSGLFSSGFGAVKDDPAHEVVQVQQPGPTNPWPPGYSVPNQPVAVQPKVTTNAQAPAESLRWRVAGHIQRVDRDTKKMVDAVILTDGQFVTYVALADCEKISLGTEYRCLFQGDWVTPWSGPRAVSVADSVLGSVPFVGGERSEQARETAPKPAPSSTNPAPRA
ncbi:zonular occludens toxin domain-containing protein [Phytopseudomonas daroniae]|uniref:zonular occludens toxin domain-containing protein n=1 Tax=Phytopseudomonas daroniae TaxID=2487519 RepID=UPI0010383A98|nr:zonular occludens toxin domain-containing protein [Pseudomonas daroniae]TBU73719.1 zonula occludens toxin [Pseudomonas daroniae]